MFHLLRDIGRHACDVACIKLILSGIHQCKNRIYSDTTVVGYLKKNKKYAPSA